MLAVTLTGLDTANHACKPLARCPVTTDPSRRSRRGHGRPTLHDVAQKAQVTRITVSRFLREPERVAPETAARIQEAITLTGYVPNRQAGGLASGVSKVVAALIPNVGHSIFAETIQGLQEGLRHSGFEVLLASTDYSLEREEAQLRAVMGWNPGALIVTGRHHTAQARRLLQAAQLAGTPVLEIWDRSRGASPSEFGQIGFNHEEVGRAMAQHLLRLGHRSLAYVDSSIAEDFRAHERGQGFALEAKAAGATVHLLSAPPGDVFDAGRLMLAPLRRAGVSAAAFANDQLACGVLMEAGERGVAVPQELAVLGFGDFPIGRQLRPALSTVHPPRVEIGRAAALALLRALATGESVAGEELPWALIARSSSTPAG